jgi:hypothetical protein
VAWTGFIHRFNTPQPRIASWGELGKNSKGITWLTASVQYNGPYSFTPLDSQVLLMSPKRCIGGQFLNI